MYRWPFLGSLSSIELCQIVDLIFEDTPFSVDHRYISIDDESIIINEYEDIYIKIFLHDGEHVYIDVKMFFPRLVVDLFRINITNPPYNYHVDVNDKFYYFIQYISDID